MLLLLLLTRLCLSLLLAINRSLRLTIDRSLRYAIARSRRYPLAIGRTISWATIPIAWTSKSSNWPSWSEPVVKHRCRWSSETILWTKGSLRKRVAHSMVLVQVFPFQGHITKVYLHLKFPLAQLPLLLQILLQPCTGRCQMLIFFVKTTIRIIICILVEHVILIVAIGVKSSSWAQHTI